MAKVKTSVLIAEKSVIVKDGLESVLGNYSQNLYQFDSFKDVYNIDLLEVALQQQHYDIVIVPLDLFSNRNKEFLKIKRVAPTTHWATVVYGYYSNDDLSMYDFSIFVTDDAETIVQKFDRHAVNASGDVSTSENLTDREIEILKGLAVGKSNKEIAEQLNISIHTVISHRKNISEKTSIRTLQGLTVYAISKHLIDVNNI